MTRPAFGDTAAAERPTFGTPARGRVDHQCVAAWGFRCPHAGPHLPPAAPDAGTAPAFPELEPTPSLWTPRDDR